MFNKSDSRSNNMAVRFGASQLACSVLIAISIGSGIALLVLVLTKFSPSSQNNNSIRGRFESMLSTHRLITSWCLLVAIPGSSALFCFWPSLFDDIMAAALLTISLIPLLVTHLCRFGLLRVRHGISNAMLSFNLGVLTWQEYLNKFEIVLQEEYHIMKPGALTKHTCYVCFLLIIISFIIIFFATDLSHIWVNSGWIGITALCTAIMVWYKTDTFDYSVYRKCDIYGGTLREMHYTSAVLMIQAILYMVVPLTFYPWISPKPFRSHQCDSSIASGFVLCLGLSALWILQARNFIKAEKSSSSSVPLQELLSSYVGYKAFLRFLVGELSIENLEFFQLSMRWRFRIACKLFGKENGLKPVASHIRLPFPMFAFQYVDRLLPRAAGSGLVLNSNEQMDLEQRIEDNPLTPPDTFVQRDSIEYFSQIPVSRKGSVGSSNSVSMVSMQQRRHTTSRLYPMYTAHGNNNCNANTTIHTEGMSSVLGLPPTIIEAEEHEPQGESRQSTTNTTSYHSYVLPVQNSLDETAMEYSRSSLIAQRTSQERIFTVLAAPRSSNEFNRSPQRRSYPIRGSLNGILRKDSTQTMSQRNTISKRTNTPMSSINSTQINAVDVVTPLTSDDDGILETQNHVVTSTPGSAVTSNTAGTHYHGTDKQDAISPDPSHSMTNYMGLIHSVHDSTNTNTSNATNTPKHHSAGTCAKTGGLPIITREFTTIGQSAVNLLAPRSSVKSPEVNEASIELQRECTPDNYDQTMHQINATEKDLKSEQHPNCNVDRSLCQIGSTTSNTTATPQPMSIPLTLPSMSPQGALSVVSPTLPTAIQQSPRSQMSVSLPPNSRTNTTNTVTAVVNSTNCPKAAVFEHKPLHKTSERVTVNSGTSNVRSNKQDDDGMEYTDYFEYDGDNRSATSLSRGLHKSKVQFTHKRVSSKRISNSVHSKTPKEEKKPLKLTIHDLLGVSPKRPCSKEQTHSKEEPPLPAPSIFARKVSRSMMSRSIMSGAEKSWFAAWSRKSPMGGQKERADTMLHYSDLSWRRMKKVMADVNMSGAAKEGMETLFQKYPKGRYLEKKGITLEEYDDAMHAAWISCWQNMNDSLRRFAKSPYYEQYLANMGQITVATQSNEVHEPRHAAMMCPVSVESIIAEVPEPNSRLKQKSCCSWE